MPSRPLAIARARSSPRYARVRWTPFSASLCHWPASTLLAASCGLRDSGVPLNLRVRIRILALELHTDTSFLNMLPAVVTQLGDDLHPTLARLTRRSAVAFDLHPGHAVWAQIKAVALIVETCRYA